MIVYLLVGIVIMGTADDYLMDPYSMLSWQYWLGLVLWSAGLTLVALHFMARGEERAR